MFEFGWNLLYVLCLGSYTNPNTTCLCFRFRKVHSNPSGQTTILIIKCICLFIHLLLCASLRSWVEDGYFNLLTKRGGTSVALTLASGDNLIVSNPLCFKTPAEEVPAFPYMPSLYFLHARAPSKPFYFWNSCESFWQDLSVCIEIMCIIYWQPPSLLED